MKKSIMIDFFDEESNLSITNANDASGKDIIEINIGGWDDDHGRDEGESILMNCDEFEEFINECSALLSYVRKIEAG